MTKDSKCTSTIRRRKGKPDSIQLGELRRQLSHAPIEQNNPHTSDEDSYILSDVFLGRTILKTLMSSEKTILLSLIAMRIVNAFLVQTYFVPDEYWQSVEVAHKLVFGYGYETWEWKRGIRGYIYPSLFAVLYQILAILKLDFRILIIKLPHVLQAVISAYGDLYLYKLGVKLSDRATAQWTLLSNILSWFTLYMSTRTLSNTTESALTLVALYYYPWPGKQNQRGSWRFIALAALSVVIRPTAAIVWVLLAAWHLQRNIHNYARIIMIYVLIGSSIVSVSVLIDRIMYGRWVFTPYKFMEFNLLSGQSSLFGTHPWHWYFSQGLPAILATHIYPFVRGVWISDNKVPLIVIVWTLVFYSFLGHKEFRFIYPILPLCMYYCGVYFQSLTTIPPPTSQDQTSQDKDKSHNKNSSDIGKDDLKVQVDNSIDAINDDQKIHNPQITVAYDDKTHSNNLWKAKMLVILLVVTNIPAALYFNLIHQRGSITVMHYLSKQSAQYDNMSVLFLTPCHSTPYYSYIHSNISMEFLRCEPNFQRDPHYVDETDLFFHDPLSWFHKHLFNNKTRLPTHIVYYDSMNETVLTALSSHKYRLCSKFFHAHITEGRVGRYVKVSCLSNA